MDALEGSAVRKSCAENHRGVRFVVINNHDVVASKAGREKVSARLVAVNVSGCCVKYDKEALA